MPWLRYRRRKPAYSFVSLVCESEFGVRSSIKGYHLRSLLSVIFNVNPAS